MNVPNILTLFRIFFAVIVFVAIGYALYDIALLFFLLAAITDALDGWWARRFKQTTIFGRIMDPFADKFLICGVFICLVTIPSLTSDKIGGFPSWLMLQPWMVIVIIGRELFVTSLRAFIEGSGGNFSAKWLGKWKMVTQCLAIILALLYLTGGAEWYFYTDDKHEVLVQDYHSPSYMQQTNKETIEPAFLAQTLDTLFDTKTWRKPVFFSMLAFFWLATGITLVSALDYCIHAVRMIRKQHERHKELNIKD